VGIAVTVGLTLPASPALGWLRPWYEDITIVQRSELIVLGRLKRGSVRSASPGAGFTQYHAQLAIATVLKGAIEDSQIPVIIYHGLSPMVGNRIVGDVTRIDLGPLDRFNRTEPIQIMDTGSSGKSLEPLVEDAGEDNLWFLRRRSGNYGREAGTGDFGIVDPQDLQPLSLQDYFLAYLSTDPEAEVKAQLALHPEIAFRAQRYLDHMEVQRILAVPDAETRIQRLLPFYIKRQAWAAGPPTHYLEARRAIIDSGEMSAPYLGQLFADRNLVELKEDIIEIWGEINFRGCAIKLVELLEEHDRFWAGQHLKPDWWNRDYQSALTQRRRRIYGEVYKSLIVLGKLGDERAINAINQTRARWDRGSNNLNREIVEQCDRALRLVESRKLPTEK